MWDARAVCATLSLALSGAQPDQLRDIQPPVALEDTPSWLIYAAAAFCAVLPAGAGWLWYRKRRSRATGTPAPPAGPCETALAGILALDLQDAARFGEGLWRVLRDYIEARFGLCAPDETTPELLAALFAACHFEPASQTRLRSLFSACDLIRYAAQRPAVAELNRIAAEAREWIAATRLEIPSTGAAVLFR